MREIWLSRVQFGKLSGLKDFLHPCLGMPHENAAWAYLNVGFKICTGHVRKSAQNQRTPLLAVQNYVVRQTRGWSILSEIRNAFYNDQGFRMEGRGFLFLEGRKSLNTFWNILFFFDTVL